MKPTSRRRLAVIAGLLLAGGLGIWLSLDGGARDPRPQATATHDRPSAVEGRPPAAAPKLVGLTQTPTTISVQTEAVSGELLSDVSVSLDRRSAESGPGDLWQLVGTCQSKQGGCSFPDILPGTYRATGTIERHIPASTLVRVARGPESVTLRLREGGGTLRGLVVTTARAPLPGAMVTAVNRNEANSPDRMAIVAKTDSAGRFTMQLRDSNVYLLKASADGYLSDARHVALAAESEVVIVASQVGILGGTVREGGRGQPVPEAEVTAYAPATFARFDVRAGADGRFQFNSLPPGSYVLTARRNTLQGRSTPIDVAPGSRQEVTVSVSGGLSISGEVVASDGSSLTDVHVRLVPDRGRHEPGVAMVAPTGVFRVEGLAPGKYEISARTLGRPQTATMLTLSDHINGLIIALLEGTRLDGRVLRASGEPCPGAEVKLSMIAQSDKDRQLWSKRQLVTDTDSEGRYLFDSLPPGRDAYLLAKCAGNETAVVEVGSLSPGGNPTIDVRLSRTAVLSGTVVRPGGGPASRAMVAWYADLQGLADFGAADDRGHFRIAVPSKANGMDVTVHAAGEDVSGFDISDQQKSKTVRISPGATVGNLVLELR